MQTAIPVSALGHPNGIALNGGEVILRLPVYRGAKNLAVRFPIAIHGDPKGAQVRVELNGHEIAQLANEQLRNAVLHATAPIPPNTQGIDVTLRSRVLQCGAAAPADIRVGSAGSIIVTQDAAAARSWRESYAGRYTIIEPQHPDNAWRARALASAYALHVLEGWRRISVSVGPAPAPGAVAIRDVSEVKLPSRAAPNGVKTFVQLGVIPLQQSGEDLDFTVPFELGQLDGVPNRLVAWLRVRATAPGRMEAVFNGHEINSLVIAPGTREVRLPIAASALRGTNTLLLQMRFDHAQTYCAAAAPELSLEGSELRWSGRGDVPVTLERRLSELSGDIVVESDTSIFPQAFVAMSTLGSVNTTIDAIDARTLQTDPQAANEIRIGAAPDVHAEGGGSYGEVHVEPNGAIGIAYIGDPAVLNRLASFSGTLFSSDATLFEFGMTGAPITRGGPFATNAQRQRQARRATYVAFIIILVVATWLIARRARRFS